MAKKLVAARALPAGHVLTAEDIVCKVPNDGLPPWHMDSFIGKSLVVPLEAEQNLSYHAIGEEG